MGTEHAGKSVEAWLFSTPRHLSTLTVNAQGYVQITMPNDAATGPHRLVIANADGSVIGWGPILLQARGLATTGGTLPLVGAALGATLLLGGALVLASRRRQRSA
ncbi:LPXTG cell wall anchor domain-containing protein [Leucobacter luti]|uniref:LPXTG cell wall anchor domain-containing protein n=1 Tax=Leucobacter luti TaxID=340320 RepID=UPI001C68EF1A|nr:LPXTG cell wall anchor domain-containing protein [Leucobacter luti]QYM76412.1 LPXTG cell wall anchor domain-containing protein [Leucobacter luti]